MRCRAECVSQHPHRKGQVRISDDVDEGVSNLIGTYDSMDVSFTDLPSIRTIRRLLNFFANSHFAPTTINTSSSTEEVTIRDLYEELLLSTKRVDLSTARGMDDSYR